MLFDEQDQNKWMLEAKESLRKIEGEKNSKKDLLVEMQTRWATKDKGRIFFEEYTKESFEGKMKVDLLYMDQLLQKLDQDKINEVESVIASLYKNVKELYEYMNIKPEIFGKNINESVINESTESIRSTLSKNIYNFLSKRFYDLPIEERENVYYERVKEESKDMILEGEEAKEVVEFAIKKCLMEDLLNNICFPFSARARLNYILEDEAYGAIFDQDELKNVYDDFNKKVNNVSKIVAVCV